MANCPAILIAAPASGQGKTTVACALARLHARQGRTLRGEGEALYVSGSTGSVKASYFHAWFASSPAAAARLFLKEAHD